MIQRTLLILSLLLLTACNNTYSWRQKLTVVVQTPDGEVSASSITEVTKTQSDAFWMPMEARGVKSSIRGEAVALEVAPGRYLFVLLDGQDQLALRAFGQFTYRSDEEFRHWAQSIEQHRGMDQVPAKYYPTMVTFSDIDNPASVRRVDHNYLSQGLGTGYSLIEINLAITDDAITSGKLETVLGWWLNLRSGPYDSMSSLQLPDDSPRGWSNLSPLKFWSQDFILEFDQINSL